MASTDFITCNLITQIDLTHRVPISRQILCTSLNGCGDHLPGGLGTGQNRTIINTVYTYQDNFAIRYLQTLVRFF